MDDTSRILAAFEQGDQRAGEELFLLVQAELKRLAEQRLRLEAPGQTLQPTALVNEVYLRLVGAARDQAWNGRNHFLAAAAEAMRRILIDVARRKKSLKRGGGRERVDLTDQLIRAEYDPDDLLDLNAALEELAAVDGVAAQVAKLRLFSGLTMEQIAGLLGMPGRTAYNNLEYAKAWLARRRPGAEAAGALNG